MYLPNSTMSYKRICQSPNGTIRTTKCFAHSGKLLERRVHKIHPASTKTGNADTRSDTNITDIHAKDGIAFKIDSRR